MDIENSWLPTVLSIVKDAIKYNDGLRHSQTVKDVEDIEEWMLQIYQFKEHLRERMIDNPEASHRRSDGQRFDIGPPYGLFPQLGSAVIPCESCWPKPWTNGDRKGAYALLDSEASVLYVGKASMGSCFAARFVAYFAYENDHSCKIKSPHWWSRTPRYVVTIAVPIEAPWEAPALEEFLI